MSEPAAYPSDTRPFYWQRFTASATSAGADLAALRSGIGKEAGSVPALWPYYTTLTEDGDRTRALVAEHYCLTLFGVHQQAKLELMHHDRIGIGTAVLALKNSGAFSPEAVDRRFAAAATATSVGELAVHLRGLITQLRGIGQALDYTRMFWDLCNWQEPAAAGVVRRRWGGQYFAPGAPTHSGANT